MHDREPRTNSLAQGTKIKAQNLIFRTYVSLGETISL